MDYTNDKKPSDIEYQRDGAVEGGDVNTFRDDRREYSRGGRGRRGGAHQSDNWRSFPDSGDGEGGDFRGGRGGRGGFRGGRGGARGGGRGGRGSYNAWTDRDATEDDQGNAAPAASDAAGYNAPRAAAPAAAEGETGSPAPQESREEGGSRWSREDDRGYGRGGRGGYSRGGGGGSYGGGRGGGRGGRRYYDAEDESGGYNARRGDDDNAEGGEGGRSYRGGGGYGGGRGGGRGGRRYYDEEAGGYNGGEGGNDGENEGGYGGGFRRGGRGGGRGRDFDYDRPRGEGRGRGRGRDFRSFRDGEDQAEGFGAPQQQQQQQQQSPAQNENAWASSPEPVSAAPAAPREAPVSAASAAPPLASSAQPTAQQTAQPTAASLFTQRAAPKAEAPAEWEESSVPVPAAPHSAIRRVTRASHLRRNCHDEAKVMELFTHHHRQTGISLDNYDSIPVEMVPRDIKPVEDFSDLLVEPALAENINRCGYKRPTPVQRYGIPVALSGNDLMACAQTGSGKTAAFLIPVVQHILVYGVSPARNRKSYPIALVLAPTRELAVQIFDEVRKLTFNTDVFYDVVYGGTRYPHRFEQDILVACPGRLRDMFNEEYLSFAAIKFLILDEADRMLEMGFEEQIEELVASRYTDMPTVDDRQTFMFSATFPQRILNLAKRYLRRKYYLLTVGRVGSTTKNITQTIENVPDNEKIDRLLQIIYGHETSDMVLIFVETKKMAEDVNRRLHREGIQSTTIHGDRRQQEREAALEDFKQKITPILVATDVASRGLDIPDVAHVVQFDMPQELDDYTHRIGRTGRAGNKGIATSFYNRNNRRLALDLHKYFSEHGQEIPKWFQQEAELVEGEALLGLDGGGGRRRGGGGGGGHRGGGGGGGGRGGGGGGTWGESRSNIPTVPSRRRAGLDDGGF